MESDDQIDIAVNKEFDKIISNIREAVRNMPSGIPFSTAISSVLIPIIQEVVKLKVCVDILAVKIDALGAQQHKPD